MAITEETRNKIKKILIYTKRISQNSLTGDYLAAFKGSGLEFDQLREYTMGDDIRFIDWHSSAKMNKMMVKQFIEERDRTIILAIDISHSSFFSSNEELRTATIAQIATTLSFISTDNKDNVGVLFFSDTVEKWIPPKKGKMHYATIVEALFSIQPRQKKTSINAALKFLLALKKRNAIVFILSDWIDDTQNYTKLLKVASVKFDLIGIRMLDQCEQALPSFGLIQMQDPETGEIVTIDTRKSQAFLQARLADQTTLFKKYKIDVLDLTIGQPFIHKMVQFFHRRIRRQSS